MRSKRLRVLGSTLDVRLPCYAFSLTLALAGCFSKPRFNGVAVDADVDARRDAGVDAVVDAVVDAQVCVFPANVTFPNRNALSFGDVSGDGLDDVALFGTEATTKAQYIFLYFGGDRPIRFGCPDLTLNVQTSGTMDRVGLVKLTPGMLWYVATHGNNLRLAQVPFVGRVAGTAMYSDGVPTNGILPTWEAPDDDLSRVPRSAFISDQRPVVSDVLFGGGGSIMRAQISNDVITQIASPVTVTDTESGAAYFALIKITGQRVLAVSGRHSHNVMRTDAQTGFTFNSSSRLSNGDGDPEGTVFAVRDYFYADNNVVAGARFPQWNTNPHPSRPTFQTVRNNGEAKTCYFDLDTTNDLTDGTVVPGFGQLNTTFAGVLTANPSGNMPTNRLLVVQNWNSDFCNTGNGSPRLYQLRAGTKADTEPLIIGGKFQNGRKQLLLFYQESPTDGECFEELIGNPQHCLAHCGEQTCAL